MIMVKIWVKGYTKPDGTKVRGHYREKSLGKSSTFAKYIEAERSLTSRGYKVLGGNPMMNGVALLGPKKQKAAIKRMPTGYKSVVYK